MKNTGFARKEIPALETALKLMFAGGYEAAGIDSVAERIMVDGDSIESLFASDDVLRLSAMKYAALQWVEEVRKELDSIDDYPEKLKTLIKRYVAGAESYPHSLSLYVDAWKVLEKSGAADRRYIAASLAEIYRIYIDLFCEVVAGMTGENDIPSADIRTVAWILVVISDGFFIQSRIRREPLDFDLIGGVIYGMVAAQLFKSGALP